jgi:hypothetical protein
MTCTSKYPCGSRLYWCAERETHVTDYTCATCAGNGSAARQHVRNHPRAKVRTLPKRNGEQAWLDSLGIQPRTHDG